MPVATKISRSFSSSPTHLNILFSWKSLSLYCSDPYDIALIPYSKRYVTPDSSFSSPCLTKVTFLLSSFRKAVASSIEMRAFLTCSEWTNTGGRARELVEGEGGSWVRLGPRKTGNFININYTLI